MIVPTVKVCTKCIFFHHENHNKFYKENLLCSHDKAFIEVDLVTGRKLYRTCKLMRSTSFGHKCGSGLDSVDPSCITPHL